MNPDRTQLAALAAQPPPSERAEIVAYLRRRAESVWGGHAESAVRHEADAIERGDHLRTKR